jgi:septum formation inhibitor-activating ATPase MinD
MTNGFESLNETMQHVFNSDKRWWDFLWGNVDKVESKFLDRKTYEYQARKIRKELVKKSTKPEINNKVDIELSHTIGIIENIDEIFRKSLKGETSMLKNKDMLHKAYGELVDRYEYFEQQYHILLQVNYELKHEISKTVLKNKTAEEQKSLLKNL